MKPSSMIVLLAALMRSQWIVPRPDPSSAAFNTDQISPFFITAGDSWAG